MTHEDAAHGLGDGRPGWDEVGAPAAAPDLASLASDTAADVVVIGLGASGLAAATRLAGRGADVVALDAVEIGAGAAGRNGGFLLAGGALFHDEAVERWGRDVAVALHRASEDELDRVADEHPTLVRRVGSLRVAIDEVERQAIDRQRVAMRRDGLEVEAYDGPEGTGLLIPADAHVHPVARCRAAAHAALAAGARLHVRSPVTAITDGRVVTDGATVHAPLVIVAVDGGIESVLPELRGRVRTARLQMLATAPTGAVAWPRPIYRRYGLDYLVQLATGEALVGGGRDVGGDAEWGTPAEPSAPVQGHLDRLVRDAGITSPVTHRWAGRSAFTDDRLPICEQVRPGVVAVGGYSGHGNLIGTRAARAAADALLDGRALSLADVLRP